MAVSHFFSQPKDYGINGFLPKGALQLFRFLLAFHLVRLDSLLSFFRFFFWKKLCEAKQSKPQQEAGNEKSERNKM